jgi:CRISPR-associated endonuclease/helicase Cas3
MDKYAPVAHLTKVGRAHLLKEHLLDTAARAQEYGAEVGCANFAYQAGLLHDVGKLAASFQQRILAENGLGPTVLEKQERDHSTAGALLAQKVLSADLYTPVALVVAGHHAGLSDITELKARLHEKQELLTEVLPQLPVLDLPTAPLEKPIWTRVRQGSEAEQAQLHADLWSRMLFSCLCDADFLDTEQFYQPSKAGLRGGTVEILPLLLKLYTHLSVLTAMATPSVVNTVRAEVQQACWDAAEHPKGIFSQTVPTGGGKTLSSLLFALRHALCHKLHRVIVVVPHIAIIEQTAAVYAGIFGTDVVLEHHSALDPDTQDLRSRLACENWDAPIIVTTMVQLFESLLGNRPGRSRKLHRIANSCIVLDEAQALPHNALVPVISVLDHLTRYFGCSVVISTATQPAFHRSAALPEGFEKIDEIIPAGADLFQRLRRVSVRWPVSLEQRTSWPDLAQEIVAANGSVLVISHQRKDVWDLCHELDLLVDPDATIPISALMTPEHRSRVIADIKARLREEKIRVVATQLLEYGVHVSFPVVYRALGGLYEMAQAAGRGNREGEMPLGDFRVFYAPSDPPPGIASLALRAALGFLRRTPNLDLFDPAVHTQFFRFLYSMDDKALDKGRALQQDRCDRKFSTVAEHFHMIDDGWSAPLVIPYGDAVDALSDLTEDVSPSALRQARRRLQRFTVTVKKDDLSAWVDAGAVQLLGEGKVAALSRDVVAQAYSPRFGLVPALILDSANKRLDVVGS